MKVGELCESYQLQIALKPAEQVVVAGYQDRIEARADAGLIRSPRESLHLTVLPLIDADDRLARPKSDIWSEHGPGLIQAIGDVLTGTKSFELRLDRIAFFSRAAVLTGKAGPLQQLRQALAQVCSIPDHALRLPDIAHVSLFRYNAPPSPLPEAEAADFLLTFDRLRLVRENIFPSLDLTLLKEFLLA